MKLAKAQACPHCQETKVVRNGRKRNGSQNLLCKWCGKQFQSHCVYQGCVTHNKALVLRMLCRGSGIRDCAAVTGVSKSVVLALIKKAAAGLILKPQNTATTRCKLIAYPDP